MGAPCLRKITVTDELSTGIRAKVDSGDYANESDVLLAGLRALDAQEAAADQWLRQEVGLSMAEVVANPDGLVRVEDVLGRIKARAARG